MVTALEPVMPELFAPKAQYTCPMHPQIVTDRPVIARFADINKQDPELEDMNRGL